MRDAVSPGLEVSGLTLKRRRRLVVMNLDWTFLPGDVRWVIGENGSGKSTLLAALAGRVRPAGGAIHHRWRREGGPTRITWYSPHMDLPREARVRDWLSLVVGLVPATADPGLAPDLPPDQRLGTLSTGERKRLLLDALLRTRSGLYLLDEPHEHLSRSARARLTRCLSDLAREAVVVVATHQGVPSPAPPRLGGVPLSLLGGGAWRGGAPA